MNFLADCTVNEYIVQSITSSESKFSYCSLSLFITL